MAGYNGNQIKYIVQDALSERQAAAFQTARQHALRAREKALETLGPCQWCHEPATRCPDWCEACWAQENKLRYDIIPRKMVHDRNEAYQ